MVGQIGAFQKREQMIGFQLHLLTELVAVAAVLVWLKLHHRNAIVLHPGTPLIHPNPARKNPALALSPATDASSLQRRTSFFHVSTVDIPSEETGFGKGCGRREQECADTTRRLDDQVRVDSFPDEQRTTSPRQSGRRLEIAKLDFRVRLHTSRRMPPILPACSMTRLYCSRHCKALETVR